MESPRNLDIWLVQRYEVVDEAPVIARYEEQWSRLKLPEPNDPENRPAFWSYFGTEWYDRVGVENLEIRVEPLRLIYRPED